MSIELAQHLMKVVWKVMLAIKKEVDPLGFNVINNNGKEAGQLVPHFHIHVIPRFHEDKNRFAFLWGTKKLEEEQMNNLQKDISENLTK
jgi:histidine triad (HIT) family protein